MNKNISIVIVVLILVGIGAGVWYNQTKNKVAGDVETSNSNNLAEQEGSLADQEKDKLAADKSAMEKDEPTTGDAMEKKDKSSYKDYSTETVQNEFKAGHKVVLFFHAPWCPYCIAANKAFLARTSDIPNGVTVLKTDYDSNKDLKQKYGVTYQHTFVQINSNGDMITKWNGGDIDNLKQNLK